MVIITLTSNGHFTEKVNPLHVKVNISIHLLSAFIVVHIAFSSTIIFTA